VVDDERESNGCVFANYKEERNDDNKTVARLCVDCQKKKKKSKKEKLCQQRRAEAI
jgi:hypothetical protein